MRQATPSENRSGEDAPASGPGRSGRRTRRGARALLVAGAVAVILAVLVGLWVLRGVDGNPGGAGVAVTVGDGASLSSMAPVLASKGVVSSAALMRIWVRLTSPPAIQAGEYVFHRHEGISAVLGQFRSGPTQVHLTIPPGFTIAQMAARVAALLPGHSASSFVRAATDGSVRSPYEPPSTDSLEGLLYPDTYYLSPSSSDRSILRAMVARFDAVAARVQLRSRSASLGITPYDAVTVASMVEREAKLPADKPKVARVIYNRLAASMPLQIDATVLYALGNPKGGVTHASYSVRSPYNTYLHQGLPPTPIASPSSAALQAALHPAAGPWLYYVVVSPDGAEAFSTTLAGQNANIARASGGGG